MLTRHHHESDYIQTHERLGIPIQVTSLERTIADVLDRTDISGGIEEVWRSLSAVQYFNIDDAIKYALLLENKTLIAKLGYFLEINRARFMVTDTHISLLETYIPKQPHYWSKKQTRGKLQSRWNLVIPESLATQSWDEKMGTDE